MVLFMLTFSSALLLVTVILSCLILFHLSFCLSFSLPFISPVIFSASSFLLPPFLLMLFFSPSISLSVSVSNSPQPLPFCLFIFPLYSVSQSLFPHHPLAFFSLTPFLFMSFFIFPPFLLSFSLSPPSFFSFTFPPSTLPPLLFFHSIAISRSALT